MYPPVVLSRTLARLLCGALMCCVPLLAGCPDEPEDDDASATYTPEDPSEPALVVRPETIDFGEVLVNTTGSASLEIANEGDADLFIGKVELQSSGGGAYALSETLSSLTLTPGTFVTLEVSFSPEAELEYGGAIRIESNDEDAALVTVPLLGSGTRGTDDDGDDVTVEEGDCDDTDDTVHPGAEEICDGQDNDCDDEIDEGPEDSSSPTPYCVDDDGDGSSEDQGDCDDEDGSVHPGADERCNSIDDDCDGETDEGTRIDGDGDGVSTCDGDCDDSDPLIKPGADERCNDLDDDCDGTADDGVPTSTFYRDADGDTYGDPGSTTTDCAAPAGFVATDTDCDDTKASIHPDATEVCNGADDNCNGQFDEGIATALWYRDQDGDGYGHGATTQAACSQPAGYVADKTDCDDTNASIHPNAAEQCNTVDDDCDLQVDEGATTAFYPDGDNDGYGKQGGTPTQACTRPSGYAANQTDCNDASASINPGAPEQCNGIDDNCNGQIDDNVATSTFYRDADGDGYGTGSQTQTGCSAPTGYVPTSGDCDDSKANINPAAAEVCNGVDEDCDGTVDDGVKTSYYVDADADGYGRAGSTATQACTAPTGYVANASDCDDTKSTVKPGATEVCNGVDDDCDGTADDGVSTSSWYRDQDGDGYGNAAQSTQACSQPAGYVADKTDCNDQNAAIKPGATELCNSVDDDCDGVVDDGAPTTTWYRDQDGDGYGNPANTTASCPKPTGYVTDKTDCNDASPTIYPGATEKCNGVDDDCDASIDEGFSSCNDSDEDGDGYTENQGDCNDTNATILPVLVDGNYTGQEDGSKAKPFNTIQEGILAVSTACPLVLVKPDTYPEKVDFIGKDIVVESTDGPDTTFIDGSALTGSLVSFSRGESADAVLDGFTITGGYATIGAGIYISNSSPTLLNNIITENETEDGGAGIFITGGDPEIRDNIFTYNVGATTASGSIAGGAILMQDSFASIKNNDFIGNEHISGGAIALLAGSEADIAQNVFELNTAFDTGGAGVGGAIYVYDSSPNIEDNLFQENASSDAGGAIYLIGGANVLDTSPTLDLNDFVDNTSGDVTLTSSTKGLGGAIYGTAVAPIITGGTFDGNVAARSGGAVYFLKGSIVDLVGVTFTANSTKHATSGAGGAIYLSNSTATVEDNVIEGNSAADGGGMTLGDVDADVLHNYFEGNSATSRGGAISLFNQRTGAVTPSITNNILQGSSAPRGGSIYFYSKVDYVTQGRVINNVIAESDSATEGAGIYVGTDAPAVIMNNIFFKVTTKEAVYVSTASTALPTLTYNDFFNNFKNVGGKITTLDSSNLFYDPQFVSYTANGQYDDNFHLKTSSQLRNAGNPQAAYDDYDATFNDIGAYGGPEGNW